MVVVEVLLVWDLFLLQVLLRSIGSLGERFECKIHLLTIGTGGVLWLGPNLHSDPIDFAQTERKKGTKRNIPDSFS